MHRSGGAKTDTFVSPPEEQRGDGFTQRQVNMFSDCLRDVYG